MNWLLNSIFALGLLAAHFWPCLAYTRTYLLFFYNYCGGL